MTSPEDRSSLHRLADILGHAPLEDWCAFEGCTVNAINIRLARGIWQNGVHVVKPKGGKRMVNLRAAKRWLEGKNHSR